MSGAAHHCTIGVGHVADKIEKLGTILGLEVKRVCWLSSRRHEATGGQV